MCTPVRATAEIGRVVEQFPESARGGKRGVDDVGEKSRTIGGPRAPKTERKGALGAFDRADSDVKGRLLARGIGIEKIGRVLSKCLVAVGDPTKERKRAKRRHVQHFVRIPGDRIRLVDAGNQMTMLRRHEDAGAMRAIHVEPESTRAGKIGEGGKGIERAGGRRAGGPDQAKRREATG